MIKQERDPFGVPASDCVVLYHTLLLGIGNGIKTFDGMAFFPGSVQVTEDRTAWPHRLVFATTV